jgi:protocatechuate 3,4-dioxygenase beta subunit
MMLALAAGIGSPSIASSPPEQSLPSVARIAPEDEPGRPLLVRGRVVGGEDDVPVAGVKIYLYHTDAEGYYTPGTNDNSNPRLKAWVQTDPEGRFEVRTIRPEPYPNSNVQRHIHYELYVEDRRRLRGEIVFDDDPNLREATRRSPPRGWVVVSPVDDDGVATCDALLRLGG